MSAILASPLSSCLVLLAGWILIGIAGLVRPMSVQFAGRTLFLAGVLCGVGIAVVGLWALAAPEEQLVLPIGLPDLPFHLRLDALSAVFLLLLGVASVGISIFSAGYFRAGEGTTAPGLLCLQYHVFLASMGRVLLADDAFAFMFAWEVMALASYFLVTTQHRIAEIRRAGYLYLLIAHVGALAILLCFGVLQGGSWELTFDAMRAAHLTREWATLAFLLALFGFGAKAGLVPLHVWLPEAHPAVDFPCAPYSELPPTRVARIEGDVAARVAVRFDELRESCRLALRILKSLPRTPHRVECPIPTAGAFGIGLIESWRGPVLMALEAGPGGEISRCHPHDPSWQNWPVLEHAIIGNIVPDFPLINKSFNLSYSGHDL
jgi:Proton-conducting membrane transporter